MIINIKITASVFEQQTSHPRNQHSMYKQENCLELLRTGTKTILVPECPVHPRHQHFDASLPHKIKKQYLHFRSHGEYFLLSWNIPEVMSRRSILFHN